MPVNFYSILHILSIVLFSVMATLFYLTDKEIKTWKFHSLLFLIIFSGVGLSHKFSIPIIGTWLSLKLSFFILIAALVVGAKYFPHLKTKFFYATLGLISLGIITAFIQPF